MDVSRSPRWHYLEYGLISRPDKRSGLSDSKIYVVHEGQGILEKSRPFCIRDTQHEGNQGCSGEKDVLRRDTRYGRDDEC